MVQLAEYNYDLPEAAIALHPPKTRGDARLLVLSRQTGAITDSQYSNLVNWLKVGDVLVINNTRVLPARLMATTPAGAERELLLLEKHGEGNDHHSSLVMYRRKIRAGDKLAVGQADILVDEVFPNGTAKISSPIDLWELAEAKGEVPLPPYMHRHEEPGDRQRYQTEFATAKGSVAAPTASLNLTKTLLAKIQDKGVEVVELTLHVGLGTFMPIRVDDIAKHKMHAEYFVVPDVTAAAVRLAKEQGRRVIAVGTTVARTLEYAAEDILTGQENISGEADIFIYPGYKFKIIDGLVTNFHAPGSTVLMLTAAFAGWENLKPAYNHAIRSGYKLLSYGDSMFIA